MKLSLIWFAFNAVLRVLTATNGINGTAFLQGLTEKYLATKKVASVYILSSNLHRVRNLTKSLLQNHNYLLPIDYGALRFIDDDVAQRHVVVIWFLHADDATNDRPLTLLANHRYLFRSNKHWLMLAIDRRIDTLLPFLNRLHTHIDTDLNVAVYDGIGLSTKIYDVYNVAKSKNGRLIVEDMGNFSSSMDASYPTMYETKYWRRRDMTGIQFKSAIVKMKNIDMSLDDYLDTDKHLELGTLNRYHYNLLMECRDMYNFSLTVEATDSWGYVQSDGSIDGLVDLLNRSVVDFGASPIFYRTERARVVDYSVGTWIMRSAFLFRKPVPKEPPIQIFVRPFSTCVWYSIAFVLLTIVVIYKAILVHETVDDGNDSNWMHSVTLCLGVICQQGSHHVPQSSSGKIFLWSILLFSTILLQFYSGYILTYILMDTPPVIRNLKDLLNSSMRMGCEDVLYFRDYFRLATDPISKAIYTEKIKNESGFYKPAEGMRLVADGGFAFYVQTSAAYPIIGDDFDAESVCDLDEIEMFRTQLMYANVQKKSPFKQLFDHCFRRLYENGNIKHMRFHWDKMAPICIKRSDRIKPVGIQEFACAPIVLACGFMVSLCALAAEILVKRFKNSTRNNNEKVRKKRNAAKGSLVGWNMRKNRAKKRLF